MQTSCYFTDRAQAGRHLAGYLEEHRGTNAAVLGLARGGLEVAAEVARALSLPLDVLVVRKVGAPHQPEFGIGAVAPGVRVVDPRTLAAVRVSDAEFEGMAQREEEEITRRLVAYRGGSHELALQGRTAILIDDGLATGVTAVAAVRYAKLHGAQKVVLAAPVCSTTGVGLLEAEADQVVCACVPPMFQAVGQWYDDFSQTTDEQVVALLARRNREGLL